MIRSSQFLRVTLRLLGATFFALACLHTSAAIDVQKAKRSRYANLDGDTIGLLDPPEECSDFYGMPHEDDCDHAVDRMPFGLLRFDESPASITNTEFLDRNTARRHLSLPYARFPQTWTVESCSVTVLMMQPRDNGTWADLVSSGRTLAADCVLNHGVGGSQLTGENNNVAMYLYHPSSKMQEYLDAISTVEMVYEPNEDCLDEGICHQSQGASGQQTRCSLGYSLAPANCCSNYQFSWSSMSAAAVGLVLGTKQFLPNNIYGWCSLLTESALSPRSPGISKHRHEEHAFGTEFEAIYGLKKRPIETKELGLPEEKSLLRRIVSTDIQSFETPQTDSGRPHTIMDKRSRLVRSGDRSPVNGRVGLPENPPQCGLVYGLPVPQDCLAAFNLLFPNFPESIDSRQVISVRRFNRRGSHGSGTTRLGVAGFVVPEAGLRGAFGKCSLTLHLRDDPYAESELAAWYDVATSFVDVIRDCAEGLGLGGRQDTGENNLLSVRVYGPSTEEYKDMIKWCDSVAQAARTLGCINGEAFSNADVSVPARVPSSGHVSPYTGRSCSTGYTPGAKDCCEAFVFVAEMVTAAVAQLLWGTLNAIVEYGYCTFVLDTLSS